MDAGAADRQILHTYGDIVSSIERIKTALGQVGALINNILQIPQMTLLGMPFRLTRQQSTDITKRLEAIKTTLGNLIGTVSKDKNRYARQSQKSIQY